MRLKKAIYLLTAFSIIYGCATIPKKPKTESISILFLGDIMAHQAQLDAALTNKGNYDFSSIFTKIAPTLQKYDLVIANLETTLAGAPYSGYPLFSSPTALASACQKAGINLFLLGNNHILDKKEKGLITTAKNLEKLNIPYLGIRKSMLEKKYYLYEKNNIRIGILNYTQFTNGNNHSSLVSYAQKKTVAQDIANLKKKHPDKIIVCIHWGKEYLNEPDSYQKKMGAFLIKQGADIVVGAHPHTIQPYIWDKKKDNLLAYSLGNFISNQRTFPRDGGLILGIKITKNNQSHTKISQVKPIPIWVEKYFTKQKAHYYILPASDYSQKPQYFRYEASYEKMRNFLNHCNKILHTNF